MSVSSIWSDVVIALVFACRPLWDRIRLTNSSDKSTFDISTYAPFIVPAPFSPGAVIFT